MSKSERSAHAKAAKNTPKQKKPWDLPDPLARGDETVEPLYEAVGRALSHWEQVENGLANLFAIFVGAPVGKTTRTAIHPAVRAYGAIVGFSSRAGMLDAAAAAFFKSYPVQDHREDWRDLYTRITGFATRRNDIAHAVAELLIDVDKDAERGWYLLPGLYVSKKYKDGEPPAYLLTSAQVNQFAQHFRELDSRVAFFHFVISTNRRTRPHKSPGPESPP